MKLAILEGGLEEGQEGYMTEIRLLEIFEECLALQQAKGRAYGAAWMRQGWMGNLARMMSKVYRLKNMLWTDVAYRDAESAHETALDLINLSAFFIANTQLNNKWGNING